MTYRPRSLAHTGHDVQLLLHRLKAWQLPPPADHEQPRDKEPLATLLGAVGAEREDLAEELSECVPTHKGRTWPCPDCDARKTWRMQLDQERDRLDQFLRNQAAPKKPDDLDELVIWSGQTPQTIIEIVNNRLASYNLQFVETTNDQDCKYTFVVGHPNGPDKTR